MFCMQYFRRLKQSFLAAIRFRLSGAVQKPVIDKFKLNVFYAIVVKYFFHILERSMHKDMFQVGMPNSNTCKACFGGSLYPVFKIKPAYFAVTWEHSSGRPIHAHEFHVIFHIVILSKSFN